jgi:hypothetical protein
MRSKTGISYFCKLILSKKLTAIASILILSLQVSLLGVILLICIHEHFQRIADTKCNLPLIAYKPNIAICFFVGLLPGLVVIPILAGFLLWPLILIMHAVSMLYRNKKYYPPFHVVIQSVQIMIADWLMARENTAKEKEYIKALLDVGGNDPKKMLPIEIIQIISNKVKQSQKEESIKLEKRMKRRSQSPNRNSILNLNQNNSYFYIHSGFVVLTVDSIFLPADFLNQNTLYYAVFSKDACIFTLLAILQISLPYWLYSL